MTHSEVLARSDNPLSTKPMSQKSKIYVTMSSLCRMPMGAAVMAIVIWAATGFNVFSQSPAQVHAVPHNVPTATAELPDSIALPAPVPAGDDAVSVTRFDFDDGTFIEAVPDTVPVVRADDEWERREVDWTPDPTRAVWLSALCPGLGQVYNRRYWKLPIVIGGYLGLAYATSWNNGMLRDYTRAYADLTDNDPTTKSYMDFFHGNVNEDNLDKTWLNNILKSRKNYFRRNRDLCVICMVGVYLLAMVDAYVDASLMHFDISPQLSMDVVPTLIEDARGRLPGVGMQWALSF